MSVIERLFERPKILGEIERYVVENTSGDPGARTPGAHVLLQAYVVNAHLMPTTIRSWDLEVERNGNQYKATPLDIPDDFELIDERGRPAPYDWPRAKLYDLAWSTALGRECPLRGWLRFLVDGITAGELAGGAKLTVRATDARGRVHTFSKVTGFKRPMAAGAAAGYSPGSGLKNQAISPTRINGQLRM